MNKIHRKINKGFTLLEILLVIAAIGILATIVLVAINPNRQLAQVRDAQRKSDLNTINKALEQYLIDNGRYPIGIDNTYKEICNTGSNSINQGTVGSNCVDLRVLVSDYLASIPIDPLGFNYKVGINPDNNKTSVTSDSSESGEVALNKFLVVLAGAADSSFYNGVSSGFDTSVRAIAIQPDYKTIVGGEFTSYQGVGANRIIRLNSDGSLDTSFNMATGFNSTVNTLAIQPDYKTIVGGEFTSYQGVGANRIIRLNSDGSRDTSFNMATGFNSTVNTLAIQPDGKILVGGGFTTYQGVGSNRIIRLNSDGSRDTSFNMATGFNSTVNTLTIQPDGKILVGGQFTTYQGVGANYIIRLNSDGGRDISFDMGTGFNTSVNTLTIQPDGKILVGGSFTIYQGVGANRMIRLNSDGSRDTIFNMGTGFSSTVNTLAIQPDGKILVGGFFATYQGVGANYIIRLNSDGSRDTSFNMATGFNGVVRTLTLQPDGKIIVGGQFTTYQGVGANRIIQLNSDGSRDNSLALGISTGFSSIGFSTVNTLTIQLDGKILVGGEFTSYQGVGVNRIIRLNSDGGRDTSFDMGTGFNSAVSTLAIQSDGKILVGGQFSSYQGVGANRIIRLNSDGSRDTSFDMGTGFNSTISTVILQPDGRILVGGEFTSYQGVGANRIIRLNSDGSRDTSFDMGTGFSIYVSTLTIQSDGRILVGGWFTTYQGVGANYIIRLNSDGSRDTSFDMGTGFSDNVSTLAIQSDGKILVGGQFSSYQGVGANRIIRLNSDGSRDTSFNIGEGFNNSINVVSIQTNGKIIAGGSFVSYQGQPASHIIRLGN